MNRKIDMEIQNWGYSRLQDDYLRIYELYVCVEYIHSHTHTLIYIYTYIHIVSCFQGGDYSVSIDISAHKILQGWQKLPWISPRTS